MIKLCSLFLAAFIFCTNISGKSSDDKYYGIPLSSPLGTFGVVTSAGNIPSPVHLSSLASGET